MPLHAERCAHNTRANTHTLARMSGTSTSGKSMSRVHATNTIFMADWQPPMEEIKATRRERARHVQRTEVTHAPGRNRNATAALQRPQALACSRPPFLKEEIKATHARVFPEAFRTCPPVVFEVRPWCCDSIMRLRASAVCVIMGRMFRELPLFLPSGALNLLINREIQRRMGETQMGFTPVPALASETS